MTTTNSFQLVPDYYCSINECKQAKKYINPQTNPRYSKFNQTHFTAGDEEQFQQYRDATNGNICSSTISLSNNKFTNQPIVEWHKYKNIEATAVINTFRYIFNKFKKGIFVKIQDNKLKVFLPFSKHKFVNEWYNNIQIPQVDEKYSFKRYWNSQQNKWQFSLDKNKNKIPIDSNFQAFFNFINELSQQELNKKGGKFSFNPEKIEKNIGYWFANNCILRYEQPINEGETNNSIMKNMIEELCNNRQVPDIEFFMNRRDFPIITKDGTEAYYNLWNTVDQPLVSHNYEKYCPILSMSITDKYADISIPTHEDWARVQSLESKFFLPSCNSYTDIFDTPWNDKIPTAIFRGSNTGCGTTIDTNTRLKVSYLSSTTSPDENNIPYLDAGITNWNTRIRKQYGNPYLQTIDIQNMPRLVTRLSRLEQSKYKYIINIDGHVSAFRLSIELGMGSVPLIVNSQWKMWFSNLLQPFIHYVPINEDLSNLVDQIKWCRENDEKCKQIAINAKIFFDTYLQKDGIFDYLQKTLVNIKKQTGTYLYNSISPLDFQINFELANISFDYPETSKQIQDITTIPNTIRSHSLLQGIHWVINFINKNNNFELVAVENQQIVRNKMSSITKFTLANFQFIVKSTNDFVKKKENIHEAFIGTKVINNLIKYIPNFSYIFGLYQKDDYYNLITEYIEGQTFLDYIKSNFIFKEYLLILIQLSLALQVAQNHCAFTHYDLSPWNIIIKRLEKPIKIDYILKYDKIIRVKTNIIPIIIDYGKSHVVYNDRHHGFINMFRTSSFQDIISILITSIKSITSLNSNYNTELFILANSMSKTGFLQEPIKDLNDLNNFLFKNSTYTDQISSQKYELEQKLPIDFVNYIIKSFTNYSFPVTKTRAYISNDIGNARQVFDYILSNNINDKINSFTNIFSISLNCQLPTIPNLFLTYYSAQKIYDNINSVKNIMIDFLTENNITTKDYEDIADQTLNFISSVYNNLIDNNIYKTELFYNITTDFSKFIVSPYTEETFLIPDNINTLISPLIIDNFSIYKIIIESVILNNGQYQLSDQNKQFYMINFNTLLNTSSLIMQNNTANVNTLQIISKFIYSNNLQTFIGHCDNFKKYKEIINALQYKDN